MFKFYISAMSFTTDIVYEESEMKNVILLLYTTALPQNMKPTWEIPDSTWNPQQSRQGSYYSMMQAS